MPTSGGLPTDGSAAPERLTDSPGDDRAPVYSPDGSQILFDSTRDGNTEIYVMNADGGNQRRLTNDPGEDWGATWSPDGTFIAFNSDRGGPMDIWVMRADGTGLRRVTIGALARRRTGGAKLVAGRHEDRLHLSPG